VTDNRESILIRPVTRRDLLRGGLALGVVVPAAGLLSSCGGGGGGQGASASISPTSAAVPDYYPKDYSALIEGSKKEGGSLTIYSNMADNNWKPIIDAFKVQCPWVTSVSTNNLDSAEVFSKYSSEVAGGGRSKVGLMVSGDPQSWIAFSEKGTGLDYESPEKSKLPEFANPKPGVWTFSADPMLIAWNKSLTPDDKAPKSLKAMADLVAGNPDKYKSKITTYDVKNTFGFSIEYAWANQISGAWDTLDKLLPSTRAEGSSGPMVEKMNSGEYLMGYFMSSTVVLPAAQKPGSLISWGYIEDGQPMFLRGMAIPKTTPTPNTSKLMLNFLLSNQGQLAVYNGGFTPYRADVGDVDRTYQKIEEKVGKDNIVMIGYDSISPTDVSAFQDKWNAKLGH
jgi:iron(III) transport system substrate-binding protein